MNRYQQCERSILAYADELVDRIKAGRLHPDRFEALIRSQLDAPAYDVTFLPSLLSAALTRLHGRDLRNKP